MGDALALVPTLGAPVPIDLGECATEAHAGWTAFYREEYPRLARAMFAYTGDREVASELVQEAMARAWRNWSRVAHYDNPGAWTCRVAMNLANSRWRRLLHFRRTTTDAPREEPAAETDIGMRLVVRQAVDELPPRQRAAVILRYMVDLSVEDVARHMGCRPGTVTALTGKAMAKLRAHAELREPGGQS